MSLINQQVYLLVHMVVTREERERERERDIERERERERETYRNLIEKYKLNEIITLDRN